MNAFTASLIGALLGLGALGAIDAAHREARIDKLLAWQETEASERLLRCQLRPLLNSVAPGPPQAACPSAELDALSRQKARALAVGPLEIAGHLGTH
jgi:hypothetical protein